MGLRSCCKQTFETMFNSCRSGLVPYFPFEDTWGIY